MSFRVGGLASVPTNKGKRARRPSDGVVEDCGSLWRMRQHASAKKESGLLFLFALRDRSPSEHVNASHSILLFCFFFIFFIFLLSLPSAVVWRVLARSRDFPPPRRARVDQRVSKHDPSIFWSVKPDVSFTDEAK